MANNVSISKETKEKIKEILESTDTGILPFTKWNQIEINHNEDSNQEEVKSYIREKLKYVDTGVYIYTNKQEEVLYIGEGRIKTRLIRHYKKSYEEQINSPRHKFFKERRESMIVYYLPMNDKYERLAVEAMLTVIYEPSYIKTLTKKRGSSK